MLLLDSGIGNYIAFRGKRYSYFAGNNYLGLANNREVKAAAIRAIRKYGVNFSASRCTTGTADIHLELEQQLAAFKEKKDAVIFASGYQGNGILLDILKNRYSVVFIDHMAHPSTFSNFPPEFTNIHYYTHRDVAHLENLLEKHKKFRPLIITDGIFALTGEIAPLDKIYPLGEKYNAILIVDDAHSTGVLGKTGKGTPEYYNLSGKANLYQTETMSKALGSYGGFIAGDIETTGLIRDNSTTYQASTALPPAIVAAAIASLKIIGNYPRMHIQLLERALDLRRKISLLGYQTTEDNTPIIPLMFSSYNMARDLSLFLEDNGIIIPFIKYPVRLETHIVRITVSVNHTDGQVEKLLRLLKKWKDKNGKN